MVSPLDIDVRLPRCVIPHGSQREPIRESRCPAFPARKPETWIPALAPVLLRMFSSANRFPLRRNMRTRSAGMTTETAAEGWSVQLARFLGQHDGDAVTDRISKLGGAGDELLSFGVVFQRALGERAHENFEQFGVHAAGGSVGRSVHG